MTVLRASTPEFPPLQQPDQGNSRGTAEWRQDTDGGGWQGRVVYAVDDGAATVIVEAWLPAAGSELGSALAVSLCSLGVALELLTQPRRQVLGLGVGPLARLIGVGYPLRPWRALLVQVSRRAWARLGAGPRVLGSGGAGQVV